MDQTNPFLTVTARRSVGLWHLFGGLVAVILERRLVAYLVCVASNRSRIAARRVLLIGSEEAIDAFARQHQPWTLGFQIVGSCAIGDRDLRHELDRAAELGRTLEP